MAERSLTDQYSKGNAGARIDADLIAGGDSNKIAENALPDDVVTHDHSELTSGDNATLLGWRQSNTDSEGEYALWQIRNPDGTAALIDHADSEIKIKGQFTDAEAAEGKLLFDDITAGGWERYDSIRLYGTGQKTTQYTQAQARAIGNSQWEDGQVDVTTGLSLSNRWFAVETEREIDWTADPLRFRAVNVTNDPSDVAAWTIVDGSAFRAAGNNGLTDDDLRYFYTFQFTVPAGGAHLQAQRDKETSLDHITLGDGVVGVDQLNIPDEDKVGGYYIYIGEDGETFRAQHLPGVKRVFSGGLTPINITLNANSGVVRGQFTLPVNLREITHGEVEAILGLTIISRSDATIGFDASADDAIENVLGVITIDDLISAAAGVDGGVDIIQRDIYLGANVVGVLHFRIAKDANDLAGINYQYQHENGGTGATLSISPSGDFFVRETGVPTISVPPVFATALPSAAGYADDTVAYVKSGAARGVYVKQTRIAAGVADIGLAGLVIDPNSNMRQTQGSRYTHQTWADANFNARRDNQAILANAGSWTFAPAALRYIDFNYRSLTRADGQIDIVFETARAFQGNIILTPAGQYAITLLRQSSTRWGITGLSGAQVTALRSNSWTFHDTGTGASTLTEEWVKVAP